MQPMSGAYSRWIAFVRNLPQLDDAIRKRIDHINRRRMVYTLPMLVLVHLSHSLLFWLAPPAEASTNSDTLLWYHSILFGHLTMALFAFLLWRLLPLFQGRRYNLPFWIFIFTYILFAVGIASVDQIITSAITPFIVISISLSIGFLVAPLRVLLLLLFALGLLLIGIVHFSPYSDLQLSAQVNAITIVGLAFVMSFTLWQLRSRELIANRTIRRQKFEQRLANNNLRQLLAARERLLSIIAHDLRGPIGTSSETLRLLLEEWEGFDPKTRQKLLASQSESLDRTLQLLEDLLDWSRGSARRPDEEESELLEVAHLLYESSLWVNDQANRKGIRIEIDTDRNCTVNAKPRMLYTILRNLISNAIKFTPTNSVVRVSGKYAPNGREVCISVRDQGPGLPRELLSKLRDNKNSHDLVIASTPGSSGEKGHGLGLQLCTWLLQQHGSKLEIESSAQGATFSFRLPAATLHRHISESKAAQSPDSQSPAH